MHLLNLSCSYILSEKLPVDRNLSSAFRGIFGNQLKKTLCLQKNITCEQCSFDDCLFKVMYGNEEKDITYRPFIISHESTTDNKVIVTYKFFGTFLSKLESIIHVLFKIDQSSLRIGDEFIDYRLEEISDSEKIIWKEDGKYLKKPATVNLNNLKDCQGNILLHFNTPLRLKINNNLMRKFDWEQIYKTTYRRINELNESFFDNQLRVPEFLLNHAIKTYADFTWKENYRYSERQNQKMTLGGLIGEVILKGVDPDTGRILRLGEQLHIGKQTTFGLGKYSIIEHNNPETDETE